MDKGSSGAGVGIYVSSSIKAKTIRVTNNINSSLDKAWLSLKIQIIVVKIGVLYRHPSMSVDK